MKCPECKQETGFHDFYYKNDEEYFFCENGDCMFSYKYEWKRDEDNKLVTRDGTDSRKFDNLIMIETVYKDGVEAVTELTSKIK